MRIRSALIALAATCCCTGAHADQGSPNQGLLGDWGGLRTKWYQEGIDFQLNYFSEPAYNANGGTAHLLRSADQFAAAATFDLDKLWNWPKAVFKITLTDRNGNNLTADANLNTLMQVQEVYGRGNITRLTEMSYEQVFFDGKLDVKLGRLGVGGSFFPWSCQFMNLSFCGELPGNIVSTWYNWPVSQWGTRIRVVLDADMRVETGVYQINPSYLENANGFSINPPGTIGALIPLEFDWSPTLGSARLPGTYRIGAWYDTSKQPDVFLAANYQPIVLNPGIAPLQRNGESGFYFNAQQQLTTAGGSASRGLSLFLNYVGASHNTATIDQLLSIGVFDTGPFNVRPQDVLGLAAGRTQVNARVAEGQRLLNAQGIGVPVPVQNAEYPIEIFYNFNITRWLSVSPVVQYIYRPGGTRDYPNVVILGVNFGLTF